jgi:hypothetical protein
MGSTANADTTVTELMVRRVIVACDAACDVRLAIEEAAAVAARWHAALHGIFFEDENLFRLAELPFGRQISLSALGEAETLSPAALERLSSALGSAMRHRLAETSTRLGLAWSFGRIRNLPALSALAGVEGDLLIVEGAARPFSGTWRPPSAWDQLVEQPERPILLRRRLRTDTGIVLVLLAKATDWEKTLGVAFVMATAEEKIAIIALENAQLDIDAVRDLATRLAGPRRLQLESVSSESAALLRSIKRVNPALIVADSRGIDGLTIKNLLAETRADVLLMR